MRDTGDNIGGIGLAWIVLAKSTIPFPLSGGALTISLSDFEQMDDIPIHPFRAGFKQTPSDTDQGVIFNKTFDTGIPSNNNYVRDLIAKYQGQETLLIFQDFDFSFWLVFDKTEPGRFLSDFSSGVDPTDGKSNNMTISNMGTFSRVKLTLLDE